MVEVVFSDSACGSLKVAQSYGKGPYAGGCIGVVPVDDAALLEAGQEARRDWEQAVPMGGKTENVYGLHFSLSMGDISETVPGEKRLEAMKALYNCYPGGNDAALELWENSRKTLQELLTRVGHGEAVRIWYSDQPDEACGFFWILTVLERLNHHSGIYAVKLPAWEEKNGHITEKSSWADVAPGEWWRYVGLQRAVSPEEIKRAAWLWHELLKENAPLRAVINGRLRSMTAELYDPFILQEIGLREEAFHQARLIGDVLGKYQLGIGDAWIAVRMERMIQEGLLEIVTEAPQDSPVYHRILRKAALPENK